MNDIVIRKEAPDQPDIRGLLAASEAYSAALYPAESNHALDFESLKKPEVTFVVARLGGKPVGCAGLVKTSEEYIEIKSMFVDAAARRTGVGKPLMRALNDEACRLGVQYLRLETGIHQPEAIALYRGDGFIDIGPFGDYHPDPLSVFMEKRIA